ncbi:MAG: branched-chain amino acid ABC transporter permease [Desulfobacteraceae bacterium]|nr:branched-chain amino acid ABC transporter permease [Desulfobacteraceae bacterium]
MRYLILMAGVLAAGFGLSSPYQIQLLTFIGINSLLALGLNMLMGYAGQISLGHAAFFGLGAYVTGVLTAHFHWSPWLALPVAILLTAAAAFLIALPLLELSGFYLGMGTLGFGMIGYVVFRQWSSLTGGDSGLVGIPSLELGPLSFADAKNYLFLVWAVALLCIFLCDRLIHSRIGRALRAIHDSERAASSMGIDTGRLKVHIFVLSAVMAAIAGFLYAHLVSFISPGSFDFLVSIRIVTMVVIGGMASVWGALLGASVMTILPETLTVFTEYEMIVYGLIMITIMIVIPQGLFRGILDIYERARFRTGSIPAGPQA